MQANYLQTKLCIMKDKITTTTAALVAIVAAVAAWGLFTGEEANTITDYIEFAASIVSSIVLYLAKDPKTEEDPLKD